MSRIYKAPTPIPTVLDRPSVFLAGSIDMGAAMDWQTQIENALESEDFYIFNPRRNDWDSSWVQSITNQKFNEQVTWELNALERSSVIAMYFDPKGQAPISLLELGLNAKTPNKMIVCCPDGFWRKGNVDIVCNRYGITQAENLSNLIMLTIKRLHQFDR